MYFTNNLDGDRHGHDGLSQIDGPHDLCQSQMLNYFRSLKKNLGLNACVI